MEFIITVIVMVVVGFEDGQISVVDGRYNCQQVEEEWFCAKAMDDE